MKGLKVSSKPLSSTSGEEQHYSLVRDKERCIIKPQSRFGYEDLTYFSLLISNGDPSTFQEAMLNEEKDRWMGVIVEEIESLHKNQTWELAQLPEGRKVLGYKWVYKKKPLIFEK